MSDDSPGWQERSSRVIDVHSHAMPLELLRWLEDRGLTDLTGIGGEVLTLDPTLSGLPPGAPVPLPPEQYDVAARLESMDDIGVDIQAVSAAPFVFASQAADDRRVLEVTRRSNDALAEFVAGSGGRLVPLATVPVGVAGAADELARCLDDLSFAGATVGTFGGGRELDDPVNEEVWDSLAGRRCFVLLHPSRASAPDRLGDYHLLQLLGFPVETALATARLIFGGVLDRHDLQLCLAHGGGCVRQVGPRLDLGWQRKAVSQVVEQPPTHYLQRLLYDTAVFDPTVLRRLVDDVGASHVLLGTDAPFDLADRQPLATVRALGLAPDAEDAILGGNAMAVLKGMNGAVPDSRSGPGCGAVRC